MSSPLVPRVAEACDEALAQLGEGEPRARIEAVRTRLTEPLRIAIGGRLKAGKSTLVNALLGRRVAATAAGECTKVVAWYRFALQDRIEVVPREGKPWSVPPDRGGGLPADLGAGADDIDHVVVSMSARGRLGEVTVVDTPGLFSLSEGYSAGSTRFFGTEPAEIDADSRKAVRGTEALLYLMPHPSDDDRQFLEAFHTLYPESEIGAPNVVGVLSKIDMLGSGRGDPWPQARRVAGNYERKLRSTLTCVVPVAGLLAETALGDAFSEREMRDLREVAKLEEGARELALQSVDAFRGTDLLELDPERRRRLLDFLGLYGLRESLRLVDGGRRTAAGLLPELRALSGVGELLHACQQVFADRSDPLRADRALTELERICFRHSVELGPSGRRLRAAVESLRLDPALHFVEELRVLQGVDSGAVALPRDYERELIRVAKSTTPTAKLGLADDADGEALVRAALERIVAWKQIENDPSAGPKQVRAARVMRESFEQIYFDAAS